MSHALLTLSIVLFAPLGDGPPKILQVVTPKDEGIVATGLNSRGDLVGFEWVENKKTPDILEQMPIYVRGKERIALPLLKGYTATFPAAVSDTGFVVGRSSKPNPPRGRMPLSNQGFVWDEKEGIRGLGTLAEDDRSVACGISRDGTRISGMSLGDQQIRACVWERDGDQWKAIPLPQKDRLGSHVVAISDNGNYVTASEGAIPCLWSRAANGEWTREVIGDAGSMLPRAVNNAGTVVGLQHTGEGLTHAVVRVRGGSVKRLEKLAGYVRSEANAINNDGVIVGMIDGPTGSPVGPNGFVHEKGVTRIISEGGPNFAAATAVNDAMQVAGVLEKKEDNLQQQADDAEKKDKP